MPKKKRLAVAGLDGVGRHADGHERRGAVAVDGRAGHVVEAGEHRGGAGDVVAGLAAGLAATPQDILDLGPVELGHLVEHGLDDAGGQVVGTHVLE
jgi:hypothetical protein